MIATLVRADDFMLCGPKPALYWMEAFIAEHYEIKVVPRMGHAPQDAKDGPQFQIALYDSWTTASNMRAIFGRSRSSYLNAGCRASPPRSHLESVRRSSGTRVAAGTSRNT